MNYHLTCYKSKIWNLKIKRFREVQRTTKPGNLVNRILLVLIMKTFLLGRFDALEILDFFNHNRVEIGHLSDLPVTALLGCICILRALGICSMIVIYESQNHLRADTLCPRYFWWKKTYTFDQRFGNTWGSFKVKIIIFLINRNLFYVNSRYGITYGFAWGCFHMSRVKKCVEAF